MGFKADSKVKLDDISVKNGACSPPGNCDFESGQCNWVNILKEDGHGWVLANGGFLGPPTDHTTQTPHGMITDSPQYNDINLNTHLQYKSLHILRIFGKEQINLNKG